MSETTTENERQIRKNKLVGPGIGLIIMGIAYIAWWLASIEFAFDDPRWMHNFAYAIIILTVGLCWYQKTPASRVTGAIQGFMLPITASGAFNTTLMTLVTLIILILWIIFTAYERKTGKVLLDEKIGKRRKEWIKMHAIIIAWLLIAHMGLVFFFGRYPFEAQLLSFGDIGFLVNLPPEGKDFATWAFDITLTIWGIIVLHEQLQMGYNPKNKPWPRTSFWWTLVMMASGIVGVLLNVLIFGL